MICELYLIKKFNPTKECVLLSTILPAKGKMAQQTGTKRRKEFLVSFSPFVWAESQFCIEYF